MVHRTRTRAGLRTGFAVVLVAAVSAGCGGETGTPGGGGDGGTGGGGQQNVSGYSADQQAFITNRGNPPQFTINFSPRRIETWFYNLGELRAVLFDSGFFIKEEFLGPSPDLKPTRLAPGQFSAAMTQSDVTGALGSPGCQQQVGRSVVALRYRATASTPVNTVVLVNGNVASVTAGYAIRTDGSSSTDICAQ